MAFNSASLADRDGDFSDWIEIYNPTDAAINLNGWSLTDYKPEPAKWHFPQTVLQSHSYLLIFASGKDYAVAGQELHTNFKLSSEGEFLGLYNQIGTLVSAFDTAYPRQEEDLSYAWDGNEFVICLTPTPGAENQITIREVLHSPVFSHDHGFYKLPFKLTITSPDDHTAIYYTTDGSEPDTVAGILYSDSLAIDTTTVLRAIAVGSDGLKSRITSQTYIFIRDVLRQPANPPGYPSTWGPYTDMAGTAKGDYEMDPEVVQDPRYASDFEEALLSIPTISIVTDIDNLFSKSTDPDSGGIYIYTGPPETNDIPGLGDGWERRASVEYFDRNGQNGFTVDCGLRLHGGHSRRPEKTPKHSFRLAFRDEYGTDNLNFPIFGASGDAITSFNTLILRAGYGNTWLHMSPGERSKHQLIRDLWAKDLQLEMGHVAGHGNYVHLYINGLYWGIFNPTERIDKEFSAAYFGGKEDDYDVIKDYASVVDGNITAWNAMMSMARTGLSGNDNYMRIQGKNPDGSPNPAYKAYVDVISLIDYMIINLYGGNWDWDHHNWVASINREYPRKGFKFLSWDAEHILESVTQDVTGENNSNCPSELFQRLKTNPDFRRLFGDRVQKFCFNGGQLTPEACQQRWMKRADVIDTAIIAESARWGDYRRDVHPISSPPYELYTKEHWLTEQSYLMNTYFPLRTDIFLDQLKQDGLYPSVEAPVFRLNNDPVSSGMANLNDILTMTAPSGTIYYTLNGRDPYSADPAAGDNPGDTINMVYEFTGPVNLSHGMHIKARVYEDGEWSALNDLVLIISSDLSDLKITEIHFHPLVSETDDDKDYEFIELKNTGASPLDISGTRFSTGITYTFPGGTIVDPDGFIVLASDFDHFTQRYGFNPLDEYKGSLDNGGEKIVLENASADTLIAFSYDDELPWPLASDGDGYSLVPVLINPKGDPGDPVNWRQSSILHGSPGRDDVADTPDTTGQTGIQPYNLVQHSSLEPNYPNPFSGYTIIPYYLAESDHVRLSVCDFLGRELAVLVNEYQESDGYSVIFHADNLPEGIYYCRLVVGEQVVQTRKMMLVRQGRGK